MNGSRERQIETTNNQQPTTNIESCRAAVGDHWMLDVGCSMFDVPVSFSTMNFLTELREGLLISWNSILANKMRSILTTLGIVIGIVTVTLMGTAIEGLNAAFLKSISAIGSDVLYIQKNSWVNNEEWWKMRNRRDILLNDARQVAKQVTTAIAVAPMAEDFRTVKYKNRSASSVQTVGCSAETAMVSSLTVTAGRFLLPAEVDGARPVCVLGADLASNFFPHESP